MAGSYTDCDEDVKLMASSIQSAKGVYQALLITPNGKKGHFFVVDGNMRLAGARLLGSKSPLLKCEVISKSHAEHLLAMIVTAKFRFDPDSICVAEP